MGATSRNSGSKATCSFLSTPLPSYLTFIKKILEYMDNWHNWYLASVRITARRTGAG